MDSGSARRDDRSAEPAWPGDNIHGRLAEERQHRLIEIMTLGLLLAAVLLLQAPPPPPQSPAADSTPTLLDCSGRCPKGAEAPRISFFPQLELLTSCVLVVMP